MRLIHHSGRIMTREQMEVSKPLIVKYMNGVLKKKQFEEKLDQLLADHGCPVTEEQEMAK